MLLFGWKKLLIMYLAALSAGIISGLLLIKVFQVPAELVFRFSSGRIAHAAKVFDAGVSVGIDQGLMIFLWNAVAALVSMGFFSVFLCLIQRKETSLHDRCARWLLDRKE